jgi:hypothetical protein
VTSPPPKTIRLVSNLKLGHLDVENGVIFVQSGKGAKDRVGSFDNTGRVRNLKIWSPDATQTAIPFSF